MTRHVIAADVHSMQEPYNVTQLPHPSGIVNYTVQIVVLSFITIKGTDMSQFQLFEINF